jgi:hypothetical protein
MQETFSWQRSGAGAKRPPWRCLAAMHKGSQVQVFFFVNVSGIITSMGKGKLVLEEEYVKF